MVATFPDILKGPVSITGPADSPNAKNRLSGIIIDSPFSYTFVPPGSLEMARDFTVTVLQGDHRCQEGITWYPSGWTPSGTIDYILDIAAAARFTFGGLIYEYHAPGNLAGLIKNGGGTAVVTGDYGPRYSEKPEDNRAYRRDTVVNAGVLLVNNATGSGISPRSAVQVNDGGTLGGNGAIGNGDTLAMVNVHAGGKIAPGSGVGTLTLRDGLTLHDGAKLACDLGKTGDLLKVTGGTFSISSRLQITITGLATSPKAEATADAPGEWYLDTEKGIVSYYPRDGEDLSKVNLVAPFGRTLLRLKGDAASGKWVEYLRFQGLSFQYTDWVMHDTAMMDGHSAMEYDPTTTAVVYMTYAKHCEVTGCEIVHTGNWGLQFGEASNRNKAEQCHFHDLGAGGVVMGENDVPEHRDQGAESNVVHNCFIHHGGRVFHADQAGLVGDAEWTSLPGKIERPKMKFWSQRSSELNASSETDRWRAGFTP